MPAMSGGGEQVSDQSQDRAAVASEEILASLDETILQIDDDLTVLRVNHTGSPVFTRPPEVGDDLADVIGAEGYGLIKSLAESARRSGRAHGEYPGADRTYHMTVTRLDSASAFAVVFEDVTSRRKTEQVLMEVMRGKSNVLSSVGKELEIPLNSMISYANLLARPDAELDQQYRQGLVEHMADQAWDLAGIIEDLMTVAHTEIGDLHVADVPVNLFANTAQVLETMGERGRRITVTGDRSVTALGDPARLRQIVRNLLSNALSHGSEPITIDVDSTEERAILRVKDRGPGVAGDVDPQALFTKPVEDPASPGRIGIGLWIASELADLMRGHLEYHRDYGITTFEVNLPLLPEG
jgi:two-component system sensor histidine kinase MtrB